MQIKTIRRHHLTPVGMAIIKKTEKITNVDEDLKKTKPLYIFDECELVQLLLRSKWSILKKLKIELPCDPEIPLLSV